MKILAIDPGKTTGWATYFNGTIEHGLWRMDRASKRHPGAPFLELQTQIRCKLPDTTLLAIEQAFSPPGRSILTLNGYLVATMMLACENNIEFVSKSPMTMKKWATGSGKATKREVQQGIHQIMGIDTTSDEADALALLGVVLGDKGIVLEPDKKFRGVL